MEEEIQIESPAAISVLIVDDHAIYRYGLAELLKELVVVNHIDHAENGLEALQMLQKKNYNVVFLDLEMPVKSGFDFLGGIPSLQLEPPPKVIITSGHFDQVRVMNAFEKGVQGYILKNTSLKELSRALLLIAEGEQYFSKTIGDMLCRQISRKRFPNSGDLLTHQEKKVLHGICLQLSSSEIAEKMCLAEKTIKRHRSNIMEKIGAKNTVGLVIYAIQTGLFPLKIQEQ